MNIFKSIKDLFKNEPRTGNPYGLSDGEVNALRRLRASDDYQVFQSALDKLVTLHSEALKASSSSYEDSAQKHIILGIQKAGAFADEVILRIDKKREHERHQSERAGADRERRRKLALYGTPYGANRSDLFGAR